MAKKIILGIGCILLLLLVVLALAMVLSAGRTTTAREMRAFGEPPRRDTGKTLVIYYSLTGSTREVASRIAAMTGGTLFEIETERSYPGSPMLYYTARRELKGGALPALKNAAPDLADYETIFVGSPVWWYTVPGPLRAFLGQTDFRGKTVVPFCTQGGNAGNFFEYFKQAAQNAKLTAGKEFPHVRKTDPAALDAQIAEWLTTVSQ